MASKNPTPLPVRAGLERYRKQAANLLGAFRLGDSSVITAIRRYHPRLPSRANTNDRNSVTCEDIRKTGVTLADAQTVIARFHGFADWTALKHHAAALNKKNSLILKFELAVEAIVAGKVAVLKALLRKTPELIATRSTREHSATLLHYVGANGVEDYRQHTPKNVVQIAQALLAAGAEVDADLDYGSKGRKAYPERSGSTTLGLTATSCHPANAGVQIPLLQILLDASANVDGLRGGWNPVIAALHNGRGNAAAFLAKRGARLDLEAAAGTGQLKVVKGFFKRDGSLMRGATTKQMEFGFMWACEYGHKNVVAFLLQKGINAEATPHGETALHWAAYGGHAEIVKLLLKHKPQIELKDQRFNSTPLVWALHGWCYPPAEARNTQHHRVVALLMKAGARTPLVERLDRDQIKKLRRDSRMRSLLGIGRLPK